MLAYLLLLILSFAPTVAFKVCLGAYVGRMLGISTFMRRSCNDGDSSIPDDQWRADSASDAESDSYMMGESASNDANIQETVAKMLGSELKKAGGEEVSPEAKFSAIYESIKTSNTTQLDAAKILADLFPAEKLSTPFDERKVMIKLRQSMDDEDFKKTFLNKDVGDVY